MTSPPHSPDDPPDEDGLWENYKRGVTPLSLKQRVKTSPSRLKKPSQRRQSPPIPTLASGLPSAARTAPGELERNERRRLQRGDILIEERLDLHGLTREEAKAAVVHDFTLDYVRSLLARTQGNVSEAARLSGLSRVALQKILARTGERAADFR